MYCRDEVRLVDRFSATVADYFGAVNELCATIARTEGGGRSFDESYRRARQEHKRCEDARHAVEEHRAKHGCPPSAILVKT